MAGAVAERALERGIPAERIAPAGGVVLPGDLFAPDGPRLDVAEIRAAATADPQLRDLVWGGFAADRPFFGVYGKLGEAKGSFALLAAMARLKCSGIDVGLVALAHGGTAVEAGFRARAAELGLADRILQIPFLPHWRVPEFLRSCLAVCCLEQGFPITFHAPMIPREVLLSGTCLVASAELIRKLPAYEQLPHGHGCLAVRNVFDSEALSGLLAAVARDPRTAAAIGLRGRRFALERQRDMPFPALLETTLEAAAERRSIPHSAQGRAFGAEANRREPEERFPLTRLAAMATVRFRNGEAAGAPVQAIVTVDCRTPPAGNYRATDRRGRNHLAAARYRRGNRNCDCGRRRRTRQRRPSRRRRSAVPTPLKLMGRRRWRHRGAGAGPRPPAQNHRIRS